MFSSAPLRSRLPACLPWAIALVLAVRSGAAEGDRSKDRQILGTLKPGLNEQALRWQALRQVESGARRRGLAELRRAANRQGLHVAVEGDVPIRSLDYLKLIWSLGGARPLYAGTEKRSRASAEPGVVLHPGDAPALGNRVRGQLNPDLGVGRLHGTLDKRNEVLLLKAVQPDAMARTLFGNELLARKPELVREISSLRATISEGKKVGAAERSRLTALIARVVELAKIEFPEGALFKVPFEFQTGDANEVLTTSNIQPAKLISELARDLPRLAKAAASQRSGDWLTSRPVQQIIGDDCARGTGLLWALLASPKSLIVQQKLELARTPLGAPLEFRVDFMDGQAVRVTPRHSLEYLPAEGQAAGRFLENLFKNGRMPRAIRRLSGGADVAFTVGGKPKLIELNFGPESGFRDWEDYAIESNRWMEGFTGRPTLMTEWFERLFQAPLHRQRQFFASLPRDPLLKGAVAPAFVWFRDRALDRWRQQPSAAGRKRTLRYLDTLASTLARVASKDDLEAVREALTSAKLYLSGAEHTALSSQGRQRETPSNGQGGKLK